MGGPGHYAHQGCIYGEHPTIEQPGRIARQTTKRTEPSQWEPRDTPGPLDYITTQEKKFGRVDQSAVPNFSIRKKVVDASAKELRPGCTTYDVKNMSHKGAMV